MSRNRLLAIAAIVLALGAVVYYGALKPSPLEGVVDHKAITGSREGTSYSIVVFTAAGSHFDDEDVREFFDDSGVVNDSVAHQVESRYDEVFYVLSVRSGEETVGFFAGREDFNRVVPGSRIRFRVQGVGSLGITVIRVLG